MATAKMTTVRLCRAVPFDNTYKDTILFDNATQQATYFQGMAFSAASNLSYQREQSFVRYNADYDTIVNCNYLMYKNEAHGNKWFYAFVTQIVYINDGMADIYFQIDAFQTFMFDVTLNAAFVEREHVDDDTPGRHILPEPVDEGILNYQPIRYSTEYLLDTYYYLLGVASDWSTVGTPRWYNGVFSGIDLFAYENTNADKLALMQKIQGAETKQQGSVQWIAVIPALSLQSYTIDPLSHEISIGDTVGMSTISVPAQGSAMNTGYVPKNKKLLTYPYSYFTVSNNSGTLKEYHYEDFNVPGTSISFTLYSDLNLSPTVRCTPMNYLGNDHENFDAGMSLEWSTQVTYTTDVYRQWLQANRLNFATKQVSNTLSAALGIGGAIVSGATGGIAPALISGAGAVGNLVTSQMGMQADQFQKSLQSDKVHGTQGGEFLDAVLGIKKFFLHSVSLRQVDAERIDSFFNRYGYQVNVNKVPILRTRRYWNYLKCRNVNITGNCPIVHLDTIKQMFLNGVTLWHSTMVGDYSQNNDIIV